MSDVAGMPKRNKQFASAVVYLRDAADQVGPFMGQLVPAMELLFEHFEIVCVDDFSQDGSVSALEAAVAHHVSATVQLVLLGARHGIERAMRAGVDASIGDFVFLFERVSAPIGKEALACAFAAATSGADVVSAVPEGGSPLTSWVFFRVFNRFASFDVHLCTEAFSLVTRRAINRVESLNVATPLARAAYASCGLASTTVRVAMRVVEGGWDSERRERAMDSLLYYTDIGYRVAKGLALTMVALAMLALGYAIVVFATGAPVAGWTTTILLLSVCFAGLFVLMVIAIKYLSLILSQIGRRGQYALRDVRKVVKEEDHE